MMMSLTQNTWIEINISTPNSITYNLHGLDPSTLYCIQLAAFTVDTGPYSEPLCVLTLAVQDSGSASGDNATIVDTEPTPNATSSNTMMATQQGDSLAVIVGAVIGAVLAALLLVGVAALLVGVAAWRRRRLQRSKRCIL